MKHTTDEAIMYDIISAFAASPDVHANNIRVHVNGNYARLEGVVDTLAEKRAAEELALAAPGIEHVENDLVISADEDIPDLRLTEIVNDHLSLAGITEIGAVVSAGNAFLRGRTTSTSVVERAANIARLVSGVRDVISEVEIAAGVPVDDISLANDVVEAISESADVDIISLHAVSEDGHITLFGETEDEDQIETTILIASSVPGVKHVTGRMTVTGTSAVRGFPGGEQP